MSSEEVKITPRQPSAETVRGVEEKAAALEAFLAQEQGDTELTTAEKAQIAKFIRVRDSLKGGADTEEKHEEKSALWREILEWESGSDLRFRDSDLEIGDDSLSNAEKLRALASRRRGVAIRESGLNES